MNKLGSLSRFWEEERERERERAHLCWVDGFQQALQLIVPLRFPVHLSLKLGLVSRPSATILHHGAAIGMQIGWAKSGSSPHRETYIWAGPFVSFSHVVAKFSVHRVEIQAIPHRLFSLIHLDLSWHDKMICILYWILEGHLISMWCTLNF